MSMDYDRRLTLVENFKAGYLRPESRDERDEDRQRAEADRKDGDRA